MTAHSRYLSCGVLGLGLLFAGAGHAQNPLLPAWSAYVGGDFDPDKVSALVIDSAGNSYIGGTLGSSIIRNNGGQDYLYTGSKGFAAKVSPSGALLWATGFDGLSGDNMNGVALTPSGKMAVAGSDGSINDGRYAFFSTVSLADGTPGTSHWIGDGFSTNAFNAVAVDAAGYAYTVGYTSQTNQPCNVPGYQVGGVTYGTAFKGAIDAFVVKWAPNGTIVWRHYLGGTEDDRATACAITADGFVYVAGTTASPGWASLSTHTPSPAAPDGFLVKLNTNGTHVWSAFLGGSGVDAVTALAANPTNQTLFVGGKTFSADLLSGANRLNAYGGSGDGFVLKLTDTNTAFRTEWCRFVGGSAEDGVAALALTPDGKLAAGGMTQAGSWLTQAGDSAFSGVRDGFLTLLDAAGEVTWSSYAGGTRRDEVFAVAAATNTLLAVGSTFSAGWVGGGFWDEWSKEEQWPETGDFGFIAKWSSEPGTAPAVVSGPADATVHEGETVVLSVSATGTAPLAYRWFRNGQPFAGSTSNACVLAGVTPADSGNTYACLVSNYWGTAASRTATLTVIADGTLSVALSPAQAVTQGAAWRLDSGAWRGAGSTNLHPGTYAVAFADLPGWRAPEPLAAVQVLAGLTTATAGVYTAILPEASRAVSGTNVTLTVAAPAGLSTWTLAETIPPGATPTVYTSGGVWNSGARTLTFTGVEATTGTVSYTVSVVTSGVYTVSGTVTPQPSGIPVPVTGENRIIKANLVRTINGTSVTITMYQPSPTRTWYVDEYIPEGIEPLNMTGPNPYWDPETRLLSWYLRGVGQTLTYQVEGTPGSYVLSGSGNVTGSDEPIFGDTVLVIPGAEVPPPDILSLVSPAAGLLQLTFVSVAGQAYAVQTNAAPAAQGWADCLQLSGDADATTTSVPVSGPRLFYRVRVRE